MKNLSNLLYFVLFLLLASFLLASNGKKSKLPRVEPDVSTHLPVETPKGNRLSCKVVGISDGDTLTCLYQQRQLKIRLLYIDTPESGQAYGNVAKKALSDRVFGKTVNLDIKNNDRYGRTLAVVYLGSENINLTLVKIGLAWAYRGNTQKIYLNAEEQAKQQKLGLWADKNPVNPSDWRKQKKDNQQQIKALKDKVDCNQQLSCQKIATMGGYPLIEAYYQQCKWAKKKLVRNNDDIPCKSFKRE